MTSPKRLGFYWIREQGAQKWEPAELVNDGGYLKMMLLEYDMEIPIDELYGWGVEIMQIEEYEEEKD